MKNLLIPSFAAILLITNLQSCDSPHDPSPKELAPVRMESLDMKYFLEYDDLNRITKLKTTQEIAGSPLNSEHTFTYNDSGVLTESGSGSWKYVYTYEGEQIIRTDEYIDTEFIQHYTFTYDDHGRLIEYLLWQDIPEEGGLIPVSKNTYVYNEENNVKEQYLFYFDLGTDSHQKLASFFYSDYDTRINTEEYFIAYGFNPKVKFRYNNPGKMITKNRFDVVAGTDVYIYTYTDDFAVKKETHSTQVNNSILKFQTKYFLEEH